MTTTLAPGPPPEPELLPAGPTPAETLASFTAWAAGAFYLAEQGRNPGVRDYWDAFHYVATSLSVGYANIFPCTPAGRVIGAVVMMVGPALSARALDEPAAPRAPAGDGGEAGAGAIVARLDLILEELRRPGRG